LDGCDRAANVDLYLPIMAIISECYFTCHTYCDTGLERPVILAPK
jgi:hypothetical protein